jgi:hypothetical protein
MESNIGSEQTYDHEKKLLEEKLRLFEVMHTFGGEDLPGIDSYEELRSLTNEAGIYCLEVKIPTSKPDSDSNTHTNLLFTRAGKNKTYDSERTQIIREDYENGEFVVFPYTVAILNPTTNQWYDATSRSLETKQEWYEKHL